jgi:hypothetical protein
MSTANGNSNKLPNLANSSPSPEGHPPSGSLTSISFGHVYVGSQTLTELRPVRTCAEPIPEIPRTASPPIIRLPATRYQHTSLALQLPKRVIPEHARDDILEVIAARVDEPDRVFALYTKHNPGRKRADVNLYKVGARHGEMFDVIALRRYEAPLIAEDYNSKEDRPLRNTRLRSEGGNLSLEVDGSLSVGLAKMRLRTYQSELIMEAELGDAGAVKLTKSLGGYCMRLRDTSVVQSITAVGGGMLLTYAHKTDDHPHMRFCEVAGAYTEGKDRRMAVIQNPLQFVSRPEGFEGTYVARVSEELRSRVISRLGCRMSFKQYTKVRGDLGEEFVDLMLSKINCPQLLSHPLDQGRDFDSSRKGPDSLRRTPSAELAYFEIKWWKDFEAALFDARKQAKEFPDDDVYDDEVVVGAYIANLNWNVWDEMCSLTVSRVW